MKPNTRYHNHLKTRNEHIRRDFFRMRKEGNLYNYLIIRILAEQYHLSINRIKRIIYPLKQ